MLLRCRRHQTEEAAHPGSVAGTAPTEPAPFPSWEYLAPSDLGIDGAVRLADAGPGPDGSVVPGG